MDRMQSFFTRLLLASILLTAVAVILVVFALLQYTTISPAEPIPPMIYVIGLITVMAGISWALLQVLARSSVQRMNRIIETSQRFAGGDLRVRIRDSRRDEIGVLARQFDDMADTLEHNILVLRELAEHNVELAEQVEQTAIQAERARISRDLHDAIAQRLFSLSAGTAALPGLIRVDQEKGIQQARLIAELAEHTLLDLRSLLAELRPSRVLQLGLTKAIQNLCSEWQNIHQIRAECTILVNRKLPAEVEDALYRITQEALNNVVKHAKATLVSVTIVEGKREVTLSVTDNGRGFDPEESAHSAGSFGLLGMRERARAVGGVLAIESDTSEGSTVRAQLPTITES